jgi:hypothetical protein
MDKPHVVDDDDLHGRRNCVFGLATLFLITAICAVIWSVIGMLGGLLVEYALNVVGLAFLCLGRVVRCEDCLRCFTTGDLVIESHGSLTSFALYRAAMATCPVARTIMTDIL